MSKLLDARFRSGSRLLIGLSCLVAASGSSQETWLEESRRIIEEARLEPAPEWLRTQPGEEALVLAEELASEARTQLPNPGSTRGEQKHLLIFGSFSIPEGTLRALLSEATEANVTLVFRGVPRGSTIHEVIRRLKRVSDGERVPNVLIDPTLFRRYGVSVVPTMALERGEGKKPIVVSGAVTADWLRRRSDSVVSGSEDLGRRGEVFEIAEADLIEEMQQRLANIDWAARRQAAIDNYWKRPHEFVDLEDATEQRKFLVDPSVRVTQDLEDVDGQVLVRAGQSFNPLELVPLSKTVVIFRGTDSRHVAKAAQVMRDASAQGRGVILLTTTVDVDRGWAHLESLEEQLKGTVYVLPASLAKSFHLSRAPAVVTVQGKHLLVTELPVKEKL